MIQSAFSHVLNCQNGDEFQNEVAAFTSRLGFEAYSATVVIDHMLGEAEFITVGNSQRAHKEAFRGWEDRRRDSLGRHSRRSSLPVVWGHDTLANRTGTESAPAAASNGISLALHTPEGRHFVISVERNQPVPLSGAELGTVVADLQLFAVHAQDVALRVLLPAPIDPDTPALTPRELDALRWTMEGKSLAEVSDLLNIAERTVTLHLTNATEKLGCTNTHQAVLKALRIGMLG